MLIRRYELQSHRRPIQAEDPIRTAPIQPTKIGRLPMSKFNILILGASYGSLLASKILFGGHSVKLVCLPEEANLINTEGFRVRLPVRGRADPVEIDSRRLPGKVSAAG